MKLKDFERYRRNKSKAEILIDAQIFDLNRSAIRLFDQPAGGSRPCGNGNGHRQSSGNDHADVIAHELVANTIDFIDDELGNESTPSQATIDRIRSGLSTVSNQTSVYDQNTDDFAIIYQQLDLKGLDKEITDLIATNFWQDNWQEKMRQMEKKLSNMISEQIEKIKNGVSNWATLAASLSRTLGSDAPFIAGVICLTNNCIDSINGARDQILEYEVEAGVVAEKFMDSRFTEQANGDLSDMQDNTSI